MFPVLGCQIRPERLKLSNGNLPRVSGASYWSLAAYSWEAVLLPEPSLDPICKPPDTESWKHVICFFSSKHDLMYLTSGNFHTCPPVSGNPRTSDCPKYPWGENITMLSIIGILLKNFSMYNGSGACNTSERVLIVSFTWSAVSPHPFSKPHSLNLPEYVNWVKKETCDYRSSIHLNYEKTLEKITSSQNFGMECHQKVSIEKLLLW